MSIGEIWNLVALEPGINVLILLTHYLFNSFGLAIIALTVIVNGLMYPLTLKQIKSTQMMQTLQPKLAELQKKYGKDRQRMAQEQMKLYKETGMSPTGCLVPMLVQMPIWLVLFQSIMRVLAVTPEDFLSLSQYLYPLPLVYSLVPLNNKFLWLNLAEGNLVMAILVGATMWIQQKMGTPTTTDPKQQAQTRMMLWMMPMMFGFFSLSFPSGLALFWATSSIIRIAIQYFKTGWGNLVPTVTESRVTRDKKYKRRITLEETSSEADVGADIIESGSPPPEEKPGQSVSDAVPRLRTIRRQPGRGKGHHPRKK